MKVELLAPGGSYETVITAMNAGADAVYTGGEKFGARAFANNLSLDELKSALDYAHIHGKKIYLTLNTLLKDEEISADLYDYILPLYEYGLDAVIVQDYGVMKFIKEFFPKLHIHASTQMTIAGKETVKFLENYGVNRIVAPRELSLTEIKDIKKSTSLEIESFVHGALCYCYSGQCFFSSYIGGRSGNRGTCAQPCRMEYDALKNGKILNPGNSKYVLSPKDMCTINILPEIINSGVYSLKIEGRMKKKEYTAGVVSIYRKYVDMYLSGDSYKVSGQDMKLLADLFNRNGFNESYYKMHNGKSMISLRKPEFRKENKEFIDFIDREYSDNNLKRNVELYANIKKDKPIELTAVSKDKSTIVYGEVPQQALNHPTDVASVIKRMKKLGNTNFFADTVEAYVDNNLFITVSQLNDLRRKAIKSLEEEITAEYKRNVKSLKDNLPKTLHSATFSSEEYHTSSPVISALASDINQYNVIKSSNSVCRIYLESTGFSINEYKSILQNDENGMDIYLAMPYMFRKQDKEIFKNKFSFLDKFNGYLIRNIEEYLWLKENNIAKNVIFDYNIYAYNNFAKDFCHELDTLMLTSPVELNYAECKKRDCCNEEFVVYGYMPAMISAGCIQNTCESCNKRNESLVLKDRKKEFFKIKCVCDYCYNVMYNSKPLSLFGYMDSIKSLHIQSIRLNFTTENKNEIISVIDKAVQSLNGEKVKDNDNTTRGHFKRGVL